MGKSGHGVDSWERMKEAGNGNRKNSTSMQTPLLKPKFLILAASYVGSSAVRPNKSFMSQLAYLSVYPDKGQRKSDE